MCSNQRLLCLDCCRSGGRQFGNRGRRRYNSDPLWGVAGFQIAWKKLSSTSSAPTAVAKATQRRRDQRASSDSPGRARTMFVVSHNARPTSYHESHLCLHARLGHVHRRICRRPRARRRHVQTPPLRGA
ncbi:hypothetical protein G6F59_017273 [Rhizopus arrhizus]|nr:hypothetical protein G6F59_017273 [Rhizopus arrhizus]